MLFVSAFSCAPEVPRRRQSETWQSGAVLQLPGFSHLRSILLTRLMAPEDDVALVRA